MPVKLRARNFPLARVDGQRVRGTQPFPAPEGSLAANVQCQDRVADGAFTINRDGRTFSYRSAWRDCGGNELVTETNEGSIELRAEGKFAIVIDGSEGKQTFPGTYDDSTVTVYQLGGRLDFARR